MTVFTAQRDVLERRTPHEVLLIEPWGPHSVRVRARPGKAPDDTLPGALDPPVAAHPARVTAHADGGARIVNGLLTVEADVDGSLRFLHSATGRELLSDKRPYQAYPQARTGEVHRGGTTVEAPAPLERIPVIVREGAAVADAFAEFRAGAARM